MVAQEFGRAADALMQFPPERETRRLPKKKNLLAQLSANCENDSSLVMTGPCIAGTMPKLSRNR